MPKFVFDFNLSCWVQNLAIEADNYDDALEKLKKMSAYDIVDEGYVKSFDITDLDCEEEELDESLTEDYDLDNLKELL